MPTNWQNIAALICVAAAAAYALRWLYRSVCKKSAGCGGCSSKTDPQPAARQIVSVDDLANSGPSE
jgi:hypothetical protein